METSPFITQPFIDTNIRAVQATHTDTDQVSSLLYQTAKWLRNQGSTQWSDLLEGNDKHSTADAIASGDVFLFKEGETIAGMVILLQKPNHWDLTLWGNTDHEDALYLHRLTTNRDFAGRYLGNKILTWVETGIYFPGKRRIRLDCVASNPTLNSLYRSMGYEFKNSNPIGFNTYEKSLPV